MEKIKEKEKAYGKAKWKGIERGRDAGVVVVIC